MEGGIRVGLHSDMRHRAVTVVVRTSSSTYKRVSASSSNEP